ncbi:n-acetyltransferase domain-containing protein [Nephila pilipes]|uniref:N-acetyltransferase domain-containing protein n=1 Tax=Nephila pilipes TaxID=299642 RepID=A0A8X6PKB6_NEPPI|nr:n-acetyltransferase domain-containing protein [Nephila pilipes]
MIRTSEREEMQLSEMSVTCRNYGPFFIRPDHNKLVNGNSHFYNESLKLLVVQIRASVLPAVINYDASIHGYDRSKTVTLSTSEQDSYALVAIRNGTRRVCGYGCIKSNVQGSLLVGPLYADRVDIAEEILRRLFAEFPGESNGTITIAVINCNSEAMKLVTKLQLDIGQEVPRCYKKEQVHAKFEKVFGQHALNFCPF